jgi:anti-sigma regulatory factor (Ser/Thr protein kinase)
LDEEAVDDLKIAVGEACVNAVYANEEAGRAAPVQIEWTEESDRVIVEVSDRGRPDSGEDPVTDALGVAPREVMSMALITQLVDKCEFLPREEGGTRARLVLYTPR